MDLGSTTVGVAWITDMFAELSNSPIANGSANVASVFGFVITVVVFWRISAIRRSFQLGARFPQLAADLRSHLSSLRSALEDYEGRKDRFLEELYPCASTMRWILPMTRRSARGSGRDAVWKLRGFRYLPAMRSESRARRLYNTLLEFEADLRNLSEHTKWE